MTIKPVASRVEALHEPRRSVVSIEPFSDAVQRLLTEMLLAEEMRIGGYKASLTAAKSQRAFVVPQPAFTLFDTAGFGSRAILSVRPFLRPKVEAEIALVMGEDLGGPHVISRQVRHAIAGACAALGAADSRFYGTRPGAAALGGPYRRGCIAGRRTQPWRSPAAHRRCRSQRSIAHSADITGPATSFHAEFLDLRSARVSFTK
jgi:hypothetical protein